MKLFVTDLDGTLLNSNHELTPKSIATLKRAMAQGIKVCIASGRSHGDILSLIQGHDLHPYIISSNGASAFDTNGEKIHSIGIPKEQAAEIMRYMQFQNLEFEASMDAYTYVTERGLALLHQEVEDMAGDDPQRKEQLHRDTLGLVLSQSNLVVVPTLEDLLEKIDAVNNISVISAYRNKIRNAMDHFTMDKRLMTFSSWKYNFEVTSSETSKGVALKHLCAKLDIDLKDVAAIGDNYNDLSMIKVAGIKGAMKNAVPQLISISDHLMPDNDHEGAARFLEMLLAKEPES